MFEGRVHGRLQIDYKWDGKIAAPAYTLIGGPVVFVPMRGVPSGADDHVPDRLFTVGAHRFYPLGYDFARDAAIAAVVDGRFWWLAVLRYWAQSIGKRILATLYIWGLAEHPLGEAQTWRSVYVLRWAAKVIRKVRE